MVHTTGWLKGLQVTANGTGIVSHAGVALVRALADNTALTAGLSGALASRRPSGPPEAGALEPLATQLNNDRTHLEGQEIYDGAFLAFADLRDASTKHEVGAATSGQLSVRPNELRPTLHASVGPAPTCLRSHSSAPVSVVS